MCGMPATPSPGSTRSHQPRVVPAVELDAECGTVDVFEELDRLGERRDHRPVLPADAVDRLEADAHAGAGRFLTDRAQPFDDGVAILARPCQANDTARLERGEAVYGCAHRLDSLLGLIRPGHQRQ